MVGDVSVPGVGLSQGGDLAPGKDWARESKVTPDPGAEIQMDWVFCTLALGAKYASLARQLAGDLARFAPSLRLVVGSDRPEVFEGVSNAIAFPLQQQGILACYHDKRFVLAEALKLFPVAVLIDADTRITQPVPTDVRFGAGISSGHIEDLVTHVRRYNPERLRPLDRVARKFGMDLQWVDYVGESLLVLGRDQGREQHFLELWGRIGRYCELHGIHSGEGNVIGLAAAIAGLRIQTSPDLARLAAVREHLDISLTTPKPSAWEARQERLRSRLKLTRAQISALREFGFYYL